MLAPHDREDADVGQGRLAVHDLEEPLILLRRQPMLGDLRRADACIRQGHASAATSPSKSPLPSMPPMAASMAFSGCGIKPSTVFDSLKMPAMLRAEPFGLPSGSLLPSAVT